MLNILTGFLPCSLFCLPCSLFPVPCSLPIPIIFKFDLTDYYNKKNLYCQRFLFLRSKCSQILKKNYN
ncbi:MAG: hypothetical protein F6K56_35590 [Moorea sp. SIO3G5]|nr:hypothetical protein [Moorena sp. SIO3G5]